MPLVTPSKLSEAKRSLDAAVAIIEEQVETRGAPSRVAIAQLRDAIDDLKRAVPRAGAPRPRASIRQSGDE